MNDQCPLSDEQLMDIGREMFREPRWPSTAIEFGRAVATAAVEAERKGRAPKELANHTIPEDRAALAEEAKDVAREALAAASTAAHDQSGAMERKYEMEARQELFDAIDHLAASPPPPQPAQPAALTDAQIDKVLGTSIPGGSAARDWFLPHDTQKGLENIRDVVRRMLAAAPKEPT